MSGDSFKECDRIVIVGAGLAGLRGADMPYSPAYPGAAPAPGQLTLTGTPKRLRRAHPLIRSVATFTPAR